jgi:hypothetical protein
MDGLSADAGHDFAVPLPCAVAWGEEALAMADLWD